MEFFRIIDKTTNEQILQEKIIPKNISDFSDTSFFIDGEESLFKGMVLWGEFVLSYNKIKGGVRFTLTDCPNAVSWTITTGYPPERKKVVLHCTINRTQKNKEFIEEVHEFLDEWEAGLIDNF